MLRKIRNKIRMFVRVRKNRSRCFKSEERIKELKDIYAGKRCFIVGNGPSLLVEDLEKIKDEICFGSHRIYMLFDRTKWRPTYYCAQDSKLINSSAEEITALKVERKLVALVQGLEYRRLKDVDYLNLIPEEFYPELPKFSDDVSKGIYEGYTVTYMCLQLAMYMGFKEIYLLGIDHSYSTERLPDGRIKENKGVEDHFAKEDKIENIPQTYKSTLAYEAARKYAECHGVKIYNASRGGKLDVFQRIEFDSVIN